MAITITSSLPPICFAKNIPDIILTGVTSVATISLYLDYVPFVTNIILTPNTQGQITIFARQMVRMATAAKPYESSFILNNLIINVIIGDKTYSTEGIIAPGGVNKRHLITPEWFPENFLTWQSQIIETTFKQPQWLACIVTSNTSKIKFRSKLYLADGRIYEKEFYYTKNPSSLIPTFCQVKTDFISLWGEFCEAKNNVPICYDVFGEGYNRKDTIKPTRQHPQRYILRSDRHNDTCFGFVNTLGGFDTLMMDGQKTLKPEGENTTFVNSGKESELSNGYTSFWEVSTGLIDTKRTAAQMQDFLKSTDQWVYSNAQWYKIIVDEYKVEDTPFELNAYTFKYHMAEKDECRYFERQELPDVELPTTM